MPETFCTSLCLINYQSVIIIVVVIVMVMLPVIFSTKIYSVYCKRSGLTFSLTVRTKNNASSLFILIIFITSPWMDQTVRCPRKYYEGVKLQTLFL